MKEKKSSYFTATWKMLAAVIIGGIAGGVSVVIYELMKKGIDAGIRTINGTIQQYIFPALIIIAVVTVVVGEYSLYRLKNVYKEMKDADEDRFYELDYEEEKSKVDLIIYLKNYALHCDNKTLQQAIFIVIQDLLGEKSLFQNINLVQLAQMPDNDNGLIHLYELQFYIDEINAFKKNIIP